MPDFRHLSMDKLTPEIRNLLQDKSQVKKFKSKKIEEVKNDCKNRAKNQIDSYLKLVYFRLTETETTTSKIFDQEAKVAALLSIMQDCRQQNPLFTDFED